MQRTIKGVFLKNLVKVVEKQKGPEGRVQLEEKFGDLNFSAFKDYSFECFGKIVASVCKVMYGENSPQAQFEIGKLMFEIYNKSVIGKTMFSLLGTNPKRAALGAGRAMNTVTSGLDIEIADLGPKKVKLRIKNDSQHIRHYEGVWAASAEMLNLKAKITARELAPEDHEYIVEWE